MATTKVHYRLLIALLVYCSTGVLAQDSPPLAPTFETKVNLVLVPVVVRDANGKPVGNLSKQDFQIFDKGKLQIITAFSPIHNTFDGNTPGGPMPPGLESRRGTASSSSPDSDTLCSRIYLFDDLNTDFADMATLREAAVRHFEQDFPPSDRAAIYTLSGRPNLEFTNDRKKLAETAQKLAVRLASWNNRASCPYVNYYIADMIVNKGIEPILDAAVRRTMDCAHVTKEKADMMVRSASERALVEGAQNNRVALWTLRRAIRRLSQIPGKRMIVMVSQGFHAQIPEVQRSMAEALDSAAKAGVIISGLDPHGVEQSDQDASERHEPNTQWLRTLRESFLANNDAVADLVSGTGGTFFRRNNDLRLGFTRASALPEFSYVLGFSPTDLKTDGSYHAIKIRVLERKGLKLEARHGYYAQKADLGERAAWSQIDDAVFSREETRDIPVVLQTGYSKRNDSDDAKVLIAAKLDLSGLHYKKGGGRNRDSLTVVSALFDSQGGYVSGTVKTLDLKLLDQTLEQPEAAVTLHSEFPVQRGSYVFRMVVREFGGKAMTTVTRQVIIP